MGISILPPDIHESGSGFTPVFEKKAIRFGLLAIKHVGAQAIQVMVKERDKNGPYTSLFDFVDRTSNRLITSATIKALVMSGALDSLPGDRYEKLASVELACKRLKMAKEDRKRISAGGVAVKRKQGIPESVLLEPTVEERRNTNLLSSERELIGTYLSGHPFNEVADEARKSSDVDLQGLRDLDAGSTATICGIVSDVQVLKTKKGAQTWYVIRVEDDKVSQEVLILTKEARNYHNFEQYLDKPIVIFGELEDNEEDENANPKFKLRKMYPLQSAPVRRKDTRSTSTTDDVRTSKVSQRTINRLHLAYDNYPKLITAAKAPVTLILPNGEELICE
jgi:DNA polymerase-3 subunit alpha